MRAKEFIIEGGWASTLTQNTVIGPQLVATVMKILQTDFIPKLNSYLSTKGLGHTEISGPGGSAVYYQRDLQQQPNKEYGDVDVQFHIQRIHDTSPSKNESIYRSAIKEFCDQSRDFLTDNGTNIILKVNDTDYVQVDLIMSFIEDKRWVSVLAPEWNVKGVLCNSLYSSLGEALNLSMGGGHGIQAKFQNGQLVPFKLTKDVVVKTITSDPKTWALDIAKFFGCARFSPRLITYPGMIHEVRVADIVNSIRGIAETLELAGKVDAQSLLKQIRSIYLGKINKAINSTKYAKAETPAAIKKAAHTKEMLVQKSEQIAGLIINP
jgi:hypothetical protein